MFTSKIIKYIEHHEYIDSTMLLAEKYIKSNKFDSHFLLIADFQTNARGRKGNYWSSEKGGLWFTLVLDTVSKHKSFTLYIGLCILNALIQLTKNDTFMIKWPNDIYIHDKKVCGIICTKFEKFNKISIGIGLNTNNDVPPVSNAETIKNITKVQIENDQYLNFILNNIMTNLSIFEEKGITFWLDNYNKHDYFTNKHLCITSGDQIFKGFYQGINNNGELLINDSNGSTIKINSGNIIIN